MNESVRSPRVAVLVVAYDAELTLAWVLDRIPSKFWRTVDTVIVADDASNDKTYEVALAYQAAHPELPMLVHRHPSNLGYGGNQKWGYRWALEHDIDIVVLLHGDGQYAPELIDTLVEPLADGSCDAVFGSRMMTPGAALIGGMPLYKYIGNRVLSRFQNAATGLRLTEWHSGYRAYRTDALREIAFEKDSDGFDFDTEIIVRLHEAGALITEVPIPTYYGDEVCHVNGLEYAGQVVRAVARYRLNKLGLGESQPDEIALSSFVRMSPDSVYGLLHETLVQRSPGRLLLVGCGDGQFGELLRTSGWVVIGADDVKHDAVGERLHGFVEIDYDRPLPCEVGGPFDAVVVVDALDRFRDPDGLLESCRHVLSEDGYCFVGVANFGHWYPRLRTIFGRFGYDRRGVLDRRHLRFYTRRSLLRTASAAGFAPGGPRPAGVCLDQMDWGGDSFLPAVRLLERLDRVGRRWWPTLFALQFLVELQLEQRHADLASTAELSR
jgi:glycosyltransferase involved in cell wall biosynthesis